MQGKSVDKSALLCIIMGFVNDKFCVAKNLEGWLSGLKRLTANEVSPSNGFMGSNPIPSALTVFTIAKTWRYGENWQLLSGNGDLKGGGRTF